MEKCHLSERSESYHIDYLLFSIIKITIYGGLSKLQTFKYQYIIDV